MPSTPLISPGVQISVTDNSQIPPSLPSSNVMAVVGPSVTGPVLIPTIVTSYSQFQNKFGTSFLSGGFQYEYLTNTTVANYFSQGGVAILFTRVSSGSYTSATSSLIPNSFNNTVSGSYTSSINGILTSLSSSGSFVGSFTGSYDLKPFISASTQYYAGNLNGTYTGSFSLTSASISSGSYTSLFTGSTTAPLTLSGSSVFTLSTFNTGIQMNNDGPLLSNGSFVSGSINNIKWDITNTNASNGTFSVLIRRGDDNDANPIILETFNNCSLDPLADNYIESVIGNQHQQLAMDADSGNYYIQNIGTYQNSSNYVYVSAVNVSTPNYIGNDNIPNPKYAGLLPLANYEGGFNGATGNDTATATNFYDKINITSTPSGEFITQGLTADNYTIAANLLLNSDDYKFDLLVTPGITYDTNGGNNSAISSFKGVLDSRLDFFYLIDLVNYGSTINHVATVSNGINETYAASYYPWIQTIGVETGKVIWTPPSILMAGVYAYTDNTSQPWFSPAGLSRGVIGAAIQTERKLSQVDRNTLYSSKVNPIATLNGLGITAFGQKTLQVQSSALDRVNVVRLIITLKNQITIFSYQFLFEQNTQTTANNLLNIINPYLDSVVQRQGLYTYKTKLNTTNTDIDRNQLVGTITLQPTKTLEFIYFNFNVTPTSSTFNLTSA